MIPSLVPALIKTDIYRNVSDNISWPKIHIRFVGYRWKLAVLLRQFQADPVISSCVGVLHSLIDLSLIHILCAQGMEQSLHGRTELPVLVLADTGCAWELLGSQDSQALTGAAVSGKNMDLM